MALEVVQEVMLSNGCVAKVYDDGSVGVVDIYNLDSVYLNKQDFEMVSYAVKEALRGPED